MKLVIYIALLTFSALLPQKVLSAPPSQPLESVKINLSDKASLQRGAQIFTNYCLSCHSASLMRYNRMGKDLGLTDQQVIDNLMFTTDQIGDTMQAAIRPEDAQKWFGVNPPDLSVIARARGTDWLYSYLRAFYQDDSRPMGTNNPFLVNASMPHVLWEQQGYLALDEATGEMTLAEEGYLNKRQFDQYTADLVNFLAYISEPSKIQRLALGKWVLIYLGIFFLIALALKRAYWQDVH